MPAKRPEKLEIRDIKSRLLNVSQTSYYLLSLTFPQNVIKNLSLNNEQSNNIELLCSNANLPGSSLATHDVTNDYHGVTEKMAYRRIDDETFNTTFYVDRGYNVIKAFEGWINYISGVDNKKFDDPYVNARYQYPGGTNGYKQDIYLTKFEKDVSFSSKKVSFKNDTMLDYSFIQAFPISITAMPVSYDAPDLLKCSVNFSFMRYNIKDIDATNPYNNPNVIMTKQRNFEKSLDSAASFITGAGTISEMVQINNQIA